MSLSRKIQLYEQKRGKQIAPLHDMLALLGSPRDQKLKTSVNKSAYLIPPFPASPPSSPQRTISPCGDFESLNQLAKLVKKHNQFTRGI
jgi:hypothetical protein